MIQISDSSHTLKTVSTQFLIKVDGLGTTILSEYRMSTPKLMTKNTVYTPHSFLFLLLMIGKKSKKITKAYNTITMKVSNEFTPLLTVLQKGSIYDIDFGFYFNLRGLK